MSVITFKGVELAGTLDVGNWGVNTSAGIGVLQKRKKISNLRFESTALDLSNDGCPKTSITLRTCIVEEISTELTIQKLVKYGLDYSGGIGQLQIGDIILSANAGLVSVQPAYDNKKGYGILWSFIIINDGGGMEYLEKLRNPSFDAMAVAAIEGWTATDGSGTIVQTQMFGNEELGDGQFAVAITANATGTQPLIEQTMAYAIDADSAAYENTYFKFSVDVIYQNQALTQAESSLTMTIYSAAANKAIKTFTLVSGNVQRLSIMCAVKDVYVSGQDMKVIITGAGADDDIVYIDNASLEEVTL